MGSKQLQKVIDQNPHFTPSRKTSLYSNFARLAETNEDGYEANVAAWKRVLLDATAERAFPDCTAIMAGPVLVKELSDGTNGTPLALNTVFDDMVKDKVCLPASQFLNAKEPVLSTTWGVKPVLLNTASWLAGRFVDLSWRSGSVGKLRPEKYVAVPELRARSRELLRQLEHRSRQLGGSYSSRVFSLDKLGIDTELSAFDIEACLTYLSRETKQLSYDRKRALVRLGSGPLSDRDRCIVDMREEMLRLEARGETAELQIIEEQELARDAVGKGNRLLAKYHLQKKRAAEATLKNTLALVEQLSVVVNKIDEASDQRATVDALSQGSDLLESINKEIGGVDKVADVLERVSDDVAETDAVAAELAGLTVSPHDDEEIEEELEALSTEQEKEASEPQKRLEQALEDLNAPSHLATTKTRQEMAS